MAIVFEQPPAALAGALEAALPRFAEKPSVVANMPAVAAAAKTPGRRIAAPVHVLGLDTIVRGTIPKRVAPKLWTSIIGSADGLAMADVDVGTTKFASISEGTEVRALGKLMRSLESGEIDTGQQDAKPTVLRVPALYLTAIWLQRGTPGTDDDIVIPAESALSPLQGGKPISMREFLAALKPAAEEALRHADDDTGG